MKTINPKIREAQQTPKKRNMKKKYKKANHSPIVYNQRFKKSFLQHSENTNMIPIKGQR